MENKVWTTIIHSSTVKQWAFTLGVVTLSGVLLIIYGLLPTYNYHDKQVALLHTSYDDVNQRLKIYRQAEPNYLITEKLTRLHSNQGDPFPAFILSHGTAVVSWQESDHQQKATLVLSWQEFIQFWQRLTQLNRRIKPERLQLSAQDGPILVRLTYDKK